jgi:hypothetical protein
MSDTQSNNPLSRNYRNHKIDFNPDDLKFHVSGPEFEQYKEHYCTFPSYDEAKAKIDSEVSATEKITIQNIVFEEHIVDQKGQILTITRIDRRTGDIANIDTQYFFPNVPWLRTTIQRATELKKEFTELETQLSKYRIHKSRYHSRIDADDYPRRIKSLQDEITNKRELAEQNDPAKNSNVVILNQE